MSKSYPEITRRISSNIKTLRKDIPETMAGFSAMAQAAGKDGALEWSLGREKKKLEKVEEEDDGV